MESDDFWPPVEDGDDIDPSERDKLVELLEKLPRNEEPEPEGPEPFV